MAHPELEPWISKTLLLLHTSTDESVEELRTMLTDAIHQKYNGRKTYRPIPSVAGSLADNNQKSKVKDTRSKSFLSELKLKSPSSPVTPDSYLSDTDTSTDHSDDIGMEILEADLACAVCREISFGAWNRLVECAECHSLYHQECHNPPISEMDGSDPRVVWYCRNCTKTVNKPKNSSVSSNSSCSQSSKSSSSSSSSSGSSKLQSSLSARATNSSPSFASKQFGGVPSLASKKSNVTSKSSSSSGKPLSSNLNLSSADRRLQIMKKKAARKQGPSHQTKIIK